MRRGVDVSEHIDAVAANPKTVTDVADCVFYHTMDVPGHGLVEGEWDLRGGEADYLGHTPVAGKRVLEVGTADGFFTFHMERQGAEVVSYDLDAEHSWDAVPFARALDDPRLPPSNREGDWVRRTDSFRQRITGLNNAYWLCHRAFRSRARAVYGTVYAIPGEIGPVDVTTVGAVLMHTRDPFAALASAAKLTRETMVITELRGRLSLPRAFAWTRAVVPARLQRPAMRFIPEWRSGFGADGWWQLSPEIVVAFLGVLGFEDTKVTYHSQVYRGRRRRLFTAVGRRTVG